MFPFNLHGWRHDRASGVGLGLAPRSVLRASASRNEIAIVDATGFAMQLDIWPGPIEGVRQSEARD
jgi:hypothetical protein